MTSMVSWNGSEVEVCRQVTDGGRVVRGGQLSAGDSDSESLIVLDLDVATSVAKGWKLTDS